MDRNPRRPADELDRAVALVANELANDITTLADAATSCSRHLTRSQVFRLLEHLAGLSRKTWRLIRPLCQAADKSDAHHKTRNGSF
jgi:hypothetical protein